MLQQCTTTPVVVDDAAAGVDVVFVFLLRSIYLFLSVLSSHVENLADISSTFENNRTAIATDTIHLLCDRLRKSHPTASATS